METEEPKDMQTVCFCIWFLSNKALQAIIMVQSPFIPFNVGTSMNHSY